MVRVSCFTGLLNSGECCFNWIYTQVNAALTEFILSCRGTCFKPQSVLFHWEKKEPAILHGHIPLCHGPSLLLWGSLLPASAFLCQVLSGLCVCLCVHVCMHACVRVYVWGCCGWWDFGELQDKMLKISDQDCMVRGVHLREWQVPSLGWACGATALSSSVFLSKIYFNFPSWDNYYNYSQVIHTYIHIPVHKTSSLSYAHIYITYGMAALLSTKECHILNYIY